MAINYDQIMSLKSEGTVCSYTDKETMLYALGIGFGRDPMDMRELPFVYEKDLKIENIKTVPTMGVVIASGGGLNMGKAGINFLMVLHGEQRIELHRPLPPAATIIHDSRVTAAVDKGKDKGAVVYVETKIRLKDSGEPLCTLGSSMFARGDGGFGGPSEGGFTPHEVPKRKPDMTFEAATLPGQALLYRLSGDRNPLHADPEVARKAGFDRPILHGLCTYGTTCRAIIQNVCDYDAAKITGFDVRFSSPVIPGETIVVDAWKDGNIVSFECKVKERGITVIKAGKCTLKG
ncbi:MAG TPA: MaoC/PaaZ C-terminal domain-containing protein [Alphaproteobacteria bacterium]|nr:MaoC/PaaZ C-terminal domain-containing protein [Alphaproteobacteria bacterium]